MKIIIKGLRKFLYFTLACALFIAGITGISLGVIVMMESLWGILLLGVVAYFWFICKVHLTASFEKKGYEQ